MADAVIDLQATNRFNFNAAFKTTSSSAVVKTENKSNTDEVGNVACQRNVNEQTDVSQNLVYCGSDFLANLGTFLTQAGNVQNSIVVTGLTINMSAGEYCTIDVSGHQHTENSHVAGLGIGYADISDFLPHETGEAFDGWDGFGVPDFGITPGDNSTPISASVTFSINHIDKPDGNGDHFIGKNITPRLELKMDFQGTPTSDDAAAIQVDLRANTNGMYNVIVDEAGSSDSNSDFDMFTFSAHANPALATA